MYVSYIIDPFIYISKIILRYLTIMPVWVDALIDLGNWPFGI